MGSVTFKTGWAEVGAVLRVFVQSAVLRYRPKLRFADLIFYRTAYSTKYQKCPPLTGGRLFC